MIRFRIVHILAFIGLAGLAILFVQEMNKRPSEVIEFEGTANEERGIECKPFVVRKARTPSFAFCSVKARFIGLPKSIPFVLIAIHEDDDHFSSRITSGRDLAGVTTGGHIQVADAKINIHQHITGDKFDGSENDFEESAVFLYCNDSDDVKFDLSNGRVIVLNFDSKKGSVSVTQHRIELFSPESIGHEKSETLETVSNWWNKIRKQISSEKENATVTRLR